MANLTKHGETVFHVGDTIEVHYKLIEKEKVAGKAKKEVKEEIRERIQIFEGIVIAIRGSDINESITVRRIGTGNIGIERIFPLMSPWIKKISLKRQGRVRRAKLYYLRGKVGKEAEKLKEKETVTITEKTKVKVRKPRKTKTAEHAKATRKK